MTTASLVSQLQAYGHDVSEQAALGRLRTGWDTRGLGSEVSTSVPAVDTAPARLESYLGKGGPSRDAPNRYSPRWRVIAGVAATMLLLAAFAGGLMLAGRHSSSRSLTTPPVGESPSTTLALDLTDPEVAARLTQDAFAGEWIPVGSSRKPVSGWVNGDLWRALDEAQRTNPGQPITDPRFQFTDDAPGLPVYADDHTTLIGYWVDGAGLVLLEELGQQ